MNVIIPAHLLEGGLVDTLGNDSSLRKFARTTKYLANDWHEGAVSVLRNRNNESKLENSYQSFAGERLTHAPGGNRGGMRTDLLVRCIQSTVTQNIGINVPQAEKIALGNSLASSDTPASADYVCSTVPVILQKPNNVAHSVTGRREMVATFSNENAEAVDINMIFRSPTSIEVMSDTPFIYGRLGDAAQQAVQRLFLHSSNAGTYYFNIPANATRTFVVTASTPRSMDKDTSLNYHVVEAGFKRAKATGLLDGVLARDFDEFVTNQCFNLPAAESTCATLATLFEAYELVNLAADVKIVNMLY
uniref:VP9 n=1 Tax=Kadipiro virus TaxID=104580 RepID=A0A1L3KP13_9REOV|nr:Kadipiro VP9 [Kadipiro virus]AWE75155.1 VP9 [Kadipiro virus]WFJ61589.1 VP9 [Kadipiro virus]WFJ61590.1 VP9 [Kadipiro virus]WFJ61591.1 VP9 [Kadipiro virus]